MRIRIPGDCSTFRSTEYVLCEYCLHRTPETKTPVPRSHYPERNPHRPKRPKNSSPQNGGRLHAHCLRPARPPPPPVGLPRTAAPRLRRPLRRARRVQVPGHGGAAEEEEGGDRHHDAAARLPGAAGGGGRRRGPPHRGHQAPLGLHQAEQPPGPCGQEGHRVRREAESPVCRARTRRVPRGRQASQPALCEGSVRPVPWSCVRLVGFYFSGGLEDVGFVLLARVGLTS